MRTKASHLVDRSEAEVSLSQFECKKVCLYLFFTQAFRRSYPLTSQRILQELWAYLHIETNVTNFQEDLRMIFGIRYLKLSHGCAWGSSQLVT